MDIMLDGTRRWPERSESNSRADSEDFFDSYRSKNAAARDPLLPSHDYYRDETKPWPHARSDDESDMLSRLISPEVDQDNYGTAAIARETTSGDDIDDSELLQTEPPDSSRISSNRQHMGFGTPATTTGHMPASTATPSSLASGFRLPRCHMDSAAQEHGGEVGLQNGSVAQQMYNRPPQTIPAWLTQQSPLASENNSQRSRVGSGRLRHLETQPQDEMPTTTMPPPLGHSSRKRRRHGIGSPSLLSSSVYSTGSPVQHRSGRTALPNVRPPSVGSPAGVQGDVYQDTRGHKRQKIMSGSNALTHSRPFPTTAASNPVLYTPNARVNPAHDLLSPASSTPDAPADLAALTATLHDLPDLFERLYQPILQLNRDLANKVNDMAERLVRIEEANRRLRDELNVVHAYINRRY